MLSLFAGSAGAAELGAPSGDVAAASSTIEAAAPAAAQPQPFPAAVEPVTSIAAEAAEPVATTGVVAVVEPVAAAVAEAVDPVATIAAEAAEPVAKAVEPVIEGTPGAQERLKRPRKVPTAGTTETVGAIAPLRGTADARGASTPLRPSITEARPDGARPRRGISRVRRSEEVFAWAGQVELTARTSPSAVLSEYPSSSLFRPAAGVSTGEETAMSFPAGNHLLPRGASLSPGSPPSGLLLALISVLLLVAPRLRRRLSVRADAGSPRLLVFALERPG